jgi:NADPH:quinone reductase-like Zn-dependent oxidoreductase
VVEGSLEAVEDQVEAELEIFLASRPHDLGDDLDDVRVLVRGELAEDRGRHLRGLPGLEGQAELLEREAVEVAVEGVPGIESAEYARAPESKLALKPVSLTFEQAAVTALSGLTAVQGLRDHGRVKPGHKVLIIGGSGGVGTFAVQLAKAFGAEVTAVCSTTKADLVRPLGADHVIDYTRDDFAEGDQRYDVILDIGGNASLARLRRVLGPAGTLVIAGGETGGRWLGGSDRQLRAVLLSRFTSQKLTTFICNENHQDLTFLAGLIESGKVTPVIDRTYPLADAPQAVRYLEQGHVRGKVVITI